MEAILSMDDSNPPFSYYNESMGGPKNAGIMKLVQSMNELKYISLNDQNKFELTASGLKYIRQHGKEMKHLIAKYGITPVEYEKLACFFPCEMGSQNLFSESAPQFSKLNNANVLGCDSAVDDLGDQVDDYNNIEFKDKAPGELLA